MDTPGKIMLKIVSIIYIIFGAVFALMMILSLFLGSVLAGLLENTLGALGALVSGMLFVAFLIPAAVDLVIGILGVKYADDPDKSKFFIVVGIVLTALTLLGNVFSFTVAGLIMFVMPVLYIVGGYLNRNAAVHYRR